jgi:hypothetical protein
MVHEDKYFPVERNATVGGIFLVDPETNKPYKAGVTVQQVEGGFDPTGLSTEAKQNAILSAIENLTTAFQDNEIQEVVLTDDQLPPVDGQATESKQDQILTALNTLTSLAVDDQNFRNSGVRTVTADALPLPTGASTASKQDQILTALATLTQTLSGTLEVTGTVGLEANDVTVTGQVAVTNASIPVTAAGTFPATVEGVSTSAKQDAILSALGTLLTAVQAPQPITDNNGSITVDGSVGVSGPVAVTDNNGSLTVDGTVAATQSGSWNVGISGTPTVTVSGPVTVTDGTGPLTVDGSVTVTNASIPVTQSGTWTMQTTPGASATSAALTSFRNGSITATPTSIKTSSGRVYQYTFFNMNNAPVFVHFYDALVANITPGTTVPKMSFALPAGSTLDGYWSISHGFTTAISIAASTAWAGSGAPTTPVMVTVGYA